MPHEPKVGCERDDGLLNVHLESESCEVCEPKVGELPALLPCPFCGNAEVQIVEGSTFRWRFACCTECGAQSPEARVQTMGDGTPEEWEAAGRLNALKEWNTRAEREARKDEARDAARWREQQTHRQALYGPTHWKRYVEFIDRRIELHAAALQAEHGAAARDGESTNG